MIIVIDHQQLLNPPLMQQALRFSLTDARFNRSKIFVSHQLTHWLIRVFGKADIAVGEDANQPPARFNYRNPRNPVRRHNRLGVSQRRLRCNSDWIDHHARLKPLNLTDSRHLLCHIKIAVKHANPAQLRHDNRHVSLSHRIHRG